MFLISSRKKLNLSKVSLLMGISSWVVLFITGLIVLLSKDTVLSKQSSLPLLVTIIVFVILTLICGIVAFIGAILAFVDYKTGEQNMKTFITNISINITYVVLDVFILIFIIKTVYYAQMGI